VNYPFNVRNVTKLTYIYGRGIQCRSKLGHCLWLSAGSYFSSPQCGLQERTQKTKKNMYIFFRHALQTVVWRVKAVEMLFDRVLYLEHMMPQPVMFDLQPRLNIGLFYKSAVDLWICLGMLIFCHSLLQRANFFSRRCMLAPQLRRVLHSGSLGLISV